MAGHTCLSKFLCHSAVSACLQADVQEVSSRLGSSRCILPAHQLQLIEEFRSLVRMMLGVPHAITAAATTA
jgi:hypothetical protein